MKIGGKKGGEKERKEMKAGGIRKGKGKAN